MKQPFFEIEKQIFLEMIYGQRRETTKHFVQFKANKIIKEHLKRILFKLI